MSSAVVIQNKKPLSKNDASKFTRVSEWVEAGGLSTGWSHLLLPVVKSSDKAVGFQGLRKNLSATSLNPAIIWLPLSQVVKVEDDFYDCKVEGQNYLVPHWLISAKEDEGFEFDTYQKDQDAA